MGEKSSNKFRVSRREAIINATAASLEVGIGWSAIGTIAHLATRVKRKTRARMFVTNSNTQHREYWESQPGFHELQKSLENGTRIEDLPTEQKALLEEIGTDLQLFNWAPAILIAGAIALVAMNKRKG